MWDLETINRMNSEAVRQEQAEPHEHSPRPQESVATRYSVGGQEPMAAGRCASCGLSIMFRDGRWRQSVGGVA